VNRGDTTATPPPVSGHTSPPRTAPRRHGAGVTLLTGDAANVLAGLPAGSVDCVVTSPPCWRLRDYTTTTDTSRYPDCRQVGAESTAQDYLTRLREVFGQLRRVVTARATVWLNLGDSYSVNSDGYWITQPGQSRQPRYRPVADVPHKNLVGMPWRVALALQSDGWILRSVVVWHKPNATPTPVRDRLACRYEHVFLFVRQPDYYFDLDAIRQPYIGDRALSRRAHRSGNKPTTATRVWPERGQIGRGGDPGNVWSIPTTTSRTGHPAPFPVELPWRCIAAGSPPAGTVLDPFSGAGTTGVAARQLGRSYIGIDINPAYHDLARRRLAESITSGPSAATR
jgi:DNA modification methylase